MPYTHLLFDLDNTLLDFSRSARVGFSETMRHFGLADTPEYWAIYQRHNHHCWSEREAGRMDLDTLRRTRFRLFAEEIGHAHLDGLAMNTVFLEALATHPFPVAGADELLRQLHTDGYRLVIITNGLREVQRLRIARAGWTDLFTAIVVSDEIDAAKPDPAFFEHTFTQLQHPPKADCLVIGDNLHSDILGGARYGLATCWFNYRQVAMPALNFAPSYTIVELEELAVVLRHGGK